VRKGFGEVSEHCREGMMKIFVATLSIFPIATAGYAHGEAACGNNNFDLTLELRDKVV